MSLKKFMTFGTFTALLLISLFSSPAAAQIYFFDDFENPAESKDKWEVITGDWQVADGVYHQLSTADPWQASMVAADKWKNEWEEYTIEFDVKPLTAGDAPVNVLFRVRDPVPKVWADRNGPNTHMYRWIVNGWTNTESRPYMYNAGTAVMLAQTNNSLVVGNWHHIKLVVTRTGLAGYVDDVEMFDVEHAEWTDGRVGIQAYSGMMDFDDFVVYGPGGKVFGQAFFPDPPDEATDIPRDVVLSWTPGEFAPAVNGHRVYFSQSFSDVNDGIGAISQDANSYDPGRLAFETTYYWRVDEVNAPPDSTVYPGAVWSFTTEPVGYPIDGTNITATASSAGGADFGPEKTIDGSGLNESSLHSTKAADMWLSDSEPSGAWIQYELDKVYELHQMWVWNSNQIFEGLFGFGLKDVTVEYSTNGADWTGLADVPEFAQAPGTADYTHNTTIDFGGALAKYVKLTATSNWGGLLPQYGLSEVRFFAMPVSAREPSPDAGATDVHPDVSLTWRAGREAASHNVYLSTDQQAVIDGTVPAVSATDTSYSTTLNLGSTYYWRVDEVNDAETPSIWQGDIWDFTTQRFIVVEDFEDYNDYPPYEIYSTWLDGYENPANGSQVGYLTPPAVEKTIVHDGRQSMPLIYSNTGGATYSEAERTFAVPQDWTKYGIEKLQLWFYGAVGNTGQLYVKINGVKVPYSGDAADLAVESWQSWDIDLTTVGVNIQSVTSLAIGIDGNAAAGTSYIDDIRLH